MATSNIDVRALLSALGIDATLDHGAWVARCPNPEHDDKNPSWRIQDDPSSDRHAAHYCFGCKFGGGPWELASIVWDMPIKQAGARLREMFGDGKVRLSLPKLTVVNSADARERPFALPMGVVVPGPAGEWPSDFARYLERRGVERAQLDKWGVGYALRGRLFGRVVFPVVTDGVLCTYSARAVVPGLDRYDTGRSSEGARPLSALWGEDSFDYDARTVTVAEGIFSALSLERAGATNPCAMLGSTLTPERAQILSRFERVIVATDPDDAGDQVADRIAVLARRLEVVRLTLPASPDDLPTPVLRGILHAQHNLVDPR